MASDVTRMLIQLRRGNRDVMGKLFDEVYEELRLIARSQLKQLRPGQTLNTTDLVHEAYVKLCDRSDLKAQDRVHFLALAARAMRQILVDHFRRSTAQKRGGSKRAFSLDEAGQIPIEDRGQLLLDLDDALQKLAELNGRLGEIVECRFFGGMTQDEIASALDISTRTVQNDWRKAKAFLARTLTE